MSEKRLNYLYFVQDPGAVHSAGDIDSVAPDVILWLLSSYDTGYYRSMIDTCNMTELGEQESNCSKCPKSESC